MDTMLHIKLGFKIDNVYFGWLNNELYQLPYEYNGRYFGLRKMPKKASKNGWEYYRVRRKKVGLAKLRAMFQEVDWEIRKPTELN